MFTTYIHTNKIFFISILIIMLNVLAGCTTIRPTELCTPSQQIQLKKQRTITQSRLDRRVIDLSRIRREVTQNHCVRTFFTPANKSAQCTILLARTNSLTTKVRTLRERLYELDLALAGRPFPFRHVISCKASWGVAQPKKPRLKPTVIRQQKPKTAVPKPRTKLASTVAAPSYTTTLPTLIEAEKVDAPPPPTTQSPEMPAYIAPVTATPPAERPYVENNEIRVVGSEFFQDQSAPTNRPVPAHAPAQ